MSWPQSAPLSRPEMLAALERHGRRRGDILAEERRAMKDRVIDVSRRAN